MGAEALFPLYKLIICNGGWRRNTYSILFYSILFYSILFYSILFYSILFYSILFYSILLSLPHNHSIWIGPEALDPYRCWSRGRAGQTCMAGASRCPGRGWRPRGSTDTTATPTGPPPAIHKLLKGTVTWDRFQKFWQKFTEFCLTKGRSLFLNFLRASMIL